jgi:hypothetical protein
VEAAAGRAVGRVGDFAREVDPAPFALVGRIGDGEGGQERLGVRMERTREQLARFRDLDDLADIHHDHPVADVFDDAEVMTDKEVGEAKLFLQIS